MRALRLSMAVGVAAMCVSGCAVGLNPHVVDVEPTEATLVGDAFTNTGGDVDWWFEYGKTAMHGYTTAHIGASIPKDAKERERFHVTGLDPGSVYHFRLCAQDTQEGAGPGCSQERTFSTLGAEDTDFIYGSSVFGIGGLSKQLGDFTLTAQYRRHWFPSVLREGSELNAQSVVRLEREPFGCNAPAAICEFEFRNQWDGQATARVTCLSLQDGRAVIGTSSFRGDVTEPPRLLTVVDDPAGDRFEAVDLADPPTSCPAPPADVGGIPPTDAADSYVVHEASGATVARR